MILLGILITTLTITTVEAQLVECQDLLGGGNCSIGRIKNENLSIISSKIFDDFPDLKNLRIELSNCSHINFSKTHQNLKTLYILDTPLTVLQNNTFVGLLNLTSMDIMNTSLSNVEPNAFYGLKKLESLAINWHQITSLPPTIFDPLVKISIIKISNGKLESIDMELFRYNLNLTELSLTGNQIGTLTGLLNHPIKLYLANNLITDWKKINDFLLDISKNRLSEIFIGAVTSVLFAGYNEISGIHCQQTESYNLTKLGLSNNNIEVLTCLEKMEKLVYLDVSGNDLAHLSSDDFQNNPLLKTLKIHGNKFIEINLWDMLKMPRFVFDIDNFIIENFGGPVITNISMKYCDESCTAYVNILPNSQIILLYLDHEINLTTTCRCQYNVKDNISSTIIIHMKRTFDDWVLM
jgi:Leucine-rich repeat (LRR) protein